MKTIMTGFAAAMLASAGVAASNDNTTEERFRAKYGRYTPAEESRRGAVKQAQNTALGCGREDCCHGNAVHAAAKQSVALLQSKSGTEERFKAKWGRYTQAEEARLAKIAPAERSVLAATSTPHPAVHADEAAARFQEKLGRMLETQTPAPQLLAAAPVKCELACCNRDR